MDKYLTYSEFVEFVRYGEIKSLRFEKFLEEHKSLNSNNIQLNI